MKRIILSLLIASLSFSSFSADVTKKKKKKKAVSQAKVVDAKPCATKEEILKKLEEQKTEEGAPKAFSLQGGDTGCKVK